MDITLTKKSKQRGEGRERTGIKFNLTELRPYLCYYYWVAGLSIDFLGREVVVVAAVNSCYFSAH